MTRGKGGRKAAPSGMFPGRGRAYAGRFFGLFSGRRERRRVTFVPAGGGRGTTGNLIRLLTTFASTVRGCRPPSAENSPPDCFPGAPGPQTGKATRAAARLFAGCGLPTDTETPRTSLVSLPRLGKVDPSDSEETDEVPRVPVQTGGNCRLSATGPNAGSG